MVVPILTTADRARRLRMAGTVLGVLILAYFFANVEVQIEGSAGWAMRLPTWRIEHHWLLDLLWGGRAMTGYHAWVFPCVLLFFFFPMVTQAEYTWPGACRALACCMLFWIVEDFFWFLINPAYGLAGFNAQAAPWHKHWLWLVPTDYWLYLPLAGVLYWRGVRLPVPQGNQRRSRYRQGR